MGLENSEIFHNDGVAIQGYDVVAYHEEEKAIKGERNLAYLWKGLEWRFYKTKYLELFKANPPKYIPKYGGYCAFGASQGYKARSKPQSFHIQEGKLYLNFANYVQKRWLESKGEKIKTADGLWKQIKARRPIKAHRIPIWWKYQFLKLLGKDLLK
ncbi:MAG: YHS domain-containing (seleno)protein [Bacteroidota bacterium]